MSAIKIRALDLLFFRGGKPLEFGGDKSIFPPYPSVFYGLLRSLYFGENINDFNKRETPQDPTKNLRIKGIFVVKNDEPLMVMPMDLYVSKEGSIEKTHLKERKFISSYSLPYILHADKKVKEKDMNFLPLDDFNLYLNGSAPKNYVKKNEVYITENKIGIKRDIKTRTAEEGMLYEQSYLRLRDDVSFVVEYEGIELPEKGIFRMGKDGRIIEFESTYSLDLKIPSPSKIFKLFISTPAIFKKGWRPSWINENLKIEGDLKAELIAVSIGRRIAISGWSMKDKKPKPVWRAVPPGSVYYFKFIEGDWNKLIEKFHGKCISEERAEEGFGLSFVGRVE